MKCLQCLVVLSAWTCLSVSVGIRVPSAWEEVPRRDNGGGFDGLLNSDHRFGNANARQRHNGGAFDRRMFIENEANADLGTLYNTLQSSALNNFFGGGQQMLVLGQTGLFMLPQSIQENAAVPSEKKQYSTKLPPLRHPRYPQNPQLQNNNILHQTTLNYVPRIPAIIGTNQYQNHQKLSTSSEGNEAYAKYHTLPNDVLRIMPLSSGNLNWNNYNPVEQPVLQQPVVTQFPQNYNPLVHKQHVRAPPVSHGAQVEVPMQSLRKPVAQEDTFIVSASTLSPIESDPNQDPSAGFTTKKVPIVFVTEGYRNVLVQGPNKRKKYEKPQFQNQEASKKVLTTKNIKKEDGTARNNEVEVKEKPPRRRKVTKIYKIDVNKEGPENSIGGSNRNLVQADYEKPRQYFKRPSTVEDRRSGLRNHLITNYRDDRLHEPIDDNDREREDDDSEKIKDESNKDELETEEENETEDDEEIDNEDAPKSENDNESKEESDEDKESNDNEESDDEDTEDEEEEETQKEVPHSEHADPKPVPTKPIYPGEGIWAKPGVKHRPHISQHRFLKPQEVEQRPDGYDVFEDLEKYFENQKDQFGTTFGQKIDQSGQPVPNIQINPPNPVNPIVIYDPFNESSNKEYLQQTPNRGPIFNHQGINNGHTEDTNQEQTVEQPKLNNENDEENETPEEIDDDDEESQTKKDFVPVQLYTQVRNSENEQHEAYDPLEHGRLREVIKDSKIQTVYSEEGFEDGAYDHAGHEKNAEQDQGHEEFEREKIKKGKQKENNGGDSHAGQSSKVLTSDDPVEDSLPADSIYPSLPQEDIIAITEETNILTKKPYPKSNKKNFITTQELKTTEVKDNENGDVQLEIQSEVKVIVQPNNSTKSHKYVKIYPKVLKEYPKKVPGEKKKDNDSNTEEGTKNETLLSLIATERPENNSDQSIFPTMVFTESNDIKGNIGTNTNNDDKNSSLISTKPVTNYLSTAKPTSAAKVVIKAFVNEFEKAATSERPKVTVKVLDDEEALEKINDQFGKIGSQVRKRRSPDSSDSDKDLEIDIGFIDKINHTFAEKKPDTIDVEKYPYYTIPDLNENSPLRYAENMENIPVKKGGELSFYKKADKYVCPDLPQSIDPIPEHVKNADKNAEQDESDEYEDEDDDEDDGSNKENDEEESEEESIVDKKHPPTPKTPRIHLGDKIDCLKIRYFGENPLDSPFFKEETVGPVKSIFKELDQKSAKTQNNKLIHNPQEAGGIIESVHTFNEIFNQKDKKDERKFESQVKDKVYNALTETVQRNTIDDKVTTLSSTDNENDNAESINSNIKVIKPSETTYQNQHTIISPLPLVTLITTPKYTLQLKPKNIYDQITLLDHLPEEEDVTEIIETSTESIKTTTRKEIKNQAEVTTETTKKAAQKRIDHDDGKRDSSRREPKILKQERPNNKGHEQESPETDALTRRRFRPRKPFYQIFDVNKFLTTTPYSIINPVHSTVLPKHKVISEVFYKDEIKPNEQLNVFADILNNIKNSTNADILPLQSASDFAEPDSVTISNLEEANIVPQIQTSPNVRVKKYQKDSSNTRNFIDQNPLQNLATTEKHYNARYPDSHEERHRPHSSTSKNVVNLYFNNPDKFGYMDETTPNTAKNFDFDEDSGPYRNYYNTPVVPSKKKTLRRRRKPTRGTAAPTSTTHRTTTNINVPVPNQSTPINHKPYVIDVIDDNKEIIGLVPPTKGVYRTIVEDSDGSGTNEVPEQVYEYKTIPPNYTTEPLTGVAAVTELIEQDTPSVRPMNKFHFVGLKPPLNQRARSYSEFLENKNILNGNNNIRRRNANSGYGHIRLKRNAARATYSEVSRNRGSQNEGIRKETTTPYDDIDDYVPHRPKNYYYDENTGKIVYHNKPKVEKESEEEEEEYEEIPDTPGIYLESAEDATHPTPKKVTTNPLLATATPPPEGQGLLDFVAKLKNNPSYKFIPDPTTPDPDSKSTTQESVTVDPKSTNPPEFLSILSKVRSDSSYKFIEDPKESKGKSRSTSTTPEPEYEEEEEEEEEEEGSPPHRRFVRQTDLQIFNIGDYLPKIQTPISSPVPKTPTNFFKRQIVEKIFPKLRYMTPLDIAKEKIRERFENNTVYQFIQKNIQNSPGGQAQDLANIQIFDIGEYLPKIKTVSPKTSIDYSKYKTIERPHTRHNMSSRYNADEQPNPEEVVPVRRPIVMEERESIDRPVVSEKKVLDKNVATEEVTRSTTQKIVQFRRGTRPTTQRTTAETVEPTESIATRRTANRRRPVPSGFRTTRRPLSTEATEKVQRVYPQTSQTERTQSHEHAKRVYRRRPVRIRHTTERHEEDDDTVDKIMRRSLDLDYDTDDIPNKFEEEFLEEQNIPRTYENIKKDITNGETQDKGDLISDNQEKEASESNQQEIVNTLNNDYNESDKHGENLKREHKEKSKAEIPKENPDKGNKNANTNMEIQNITEPQSEVLDTEEEGTENENIKVDVEIINHNYDKTKKHGGNYSKEKYDEDEEAVGIEEIIDNDNINKEETKLSDAIHIKPDVEIVNKNFDKTKRHGGNYKEDLPPELLKAEKKAPENTKNTRIKKTTRTNDEKLKNKGRIFITKQLEENNENNKSNNSENKGRRIRQRPKSSESARKQISRLTDVVPKPDHFYSDDRLPKEVNNLKSEESLDNLNSKELEKVAEEGDILGDVGNTPEKILDNRRSYNNLDKENSNKKLAHSDSNIENESINDPADSADQFEVVSTKKPVFIKDPSERLYFYAPL